MTQPKAPAESSQCDWPRLALEQLPCEAYVKDARGRYLYVNPLAAARLGLAAEALIGRRDRDLLPADEAEAREAGDRAALHAAGPVASEPGTWRVPLREPGKASAPPTAVLALIGLPHAPGGLPAWTDPLTGLPNEVQLLDRIVQAQHRARRTGQFALLLLLEVGVRNRSSAAEEAALHAPIEVDLAQRLRRCLRAVDTVARLGPGRFVVLAEGVGADHAGGIGFAGRLRERIRGVLASPPEGIPTGCTLTARDGFMLFRGLEPAAQELLRTVAEIAGDPSA